MDETEVSLLFDASSLETLIARSSFYAGVGARETPASELFLIHRLGAMLASSGLTLHSGASPGADRAFEGGCDSERGRKEIFLPWRAFEGHDSPYFSPPAEAFEMAARVHPNWKGCSAGARRLHARNCQQVLGERLDTPVQFVLFWAVEREGRVEGGTATAVSLARELGIPTFNFWEEETRTLWMRVLERDEERRFLSWKRLLRSLIDR